MNEAIDYISPLTKIVFLVSICIYKLWLQKSLSLAGLLIRSSAKCPREASEKVPTCTKKHCTKPCEYIYNSCAVVGAQ